MSAKVFTMEEARNANFVIIENRKGTQAVHDAVVAIQANRRSGTACTKTKAEVSFSGSKPWKQKGTGRARAGYASSPVWRKGGVVFGPKPRDYSIHLPKKVKRLAFRKALSSRIIGSDVVTVETFSVSSGKTADFVKLLAEIVGPDQKKVAIVGSSFDELTLRSARNVPGVQMLRAADLNTEEVLNFRKLILTADALPHLAQRTAA